MTPPKISPSILAADFLKLQEEVQAAERGGADRFQIDVMDGVYVPNISFGIPVVEAMRRATTKPLEAHLMIVNPDHFLDEFAQAGADLIIVHQEAAVHLDRSVQRIKDLDKKAGVALNPATSVLTLEHILEKLDLVLIMTVNPGFGGQDFISYTLEKIRKMRAMLDTRNPQCDLEVDGGIELYNIRDAYEAGANVFVAGTSVFGDPRGAEIAVQSLIKTANG
jgi:ribulose-phosphate 3-epimerase